MQEIKSGGVRTKHHGERPKHKSEKKIIFSVNLDTQPPLEAGKNDSHLSIVSTGPPESQPSSEGTRER